MAYLNYWWKKIKIKLLFRSKLIAQLRFINKTFFIFSSLILFSFSINCQNTIFIKESLFNADALDIKLQNNGALEFYECANCVRSYVHSIGYSKEIKIIRRFSIDPEISINYHKKLLTEYHRLVGFDHPTKDIYFHGIYLRPSLQIKYLSKRNKLFGSMGLNYIHYFYRSLSSSGAKVILERADWNKYFFDLNITYSARLGFNLSEKFMLSIEAEKYLRQYRNIYSYAPLTSGFQNVFQLGLTFGYSL